jgi:hypothetical protein
MVSPTACFQALSELRQFECAPYWVRLLAEHSHFLGHAIHGPPADIEPCAMKMPGCTH